MDTLTFLQNILPSSGVYYVCTAKADAPGLRHRAFTDLSEMSAFIARFTQKSSLPIYHACASYKNDFVMVDDEKKFRVAANRNLAKSFWIDLDTGEDRVHDKNGKRKGYLTKKEAWQDLRDFCANLMLPQPLVVDSGNGLHGYWVMERDLTPSEWIPVADMLAVCLAHHKVFVDTSVTRDFARVLRPVGSVNRKPNKPEREVTVKHPGKPATFEYFKSRLEAYCHENSLRTEPKLTYGPELANDLMAHAAPQIPSWAETAADHCKQLDEVRSTQGDVSYEHWRAAAGLIKHCEDAEESAIKWTQKRHINHSKTDIEHEMNTWNAGPTTCAHFENHNPGGCDGCPHREKIKSPIVLGRRELSQPETEETTVKNGTPAKVVIPEFPKGYSYINNMLCRSIEIEDRIEVVPFCPTLMYPHTRIKKEDGKYSISIRAHLPREGIKEFEIDQIVLGSTSDMVKALAANQIMTTQHKQADSSMKAYLKEWHDRLMHTSDEQLTHTHFGWQEDNMSFLIGNRLYGADGSVREVLLGSKARTKAVNFPEKLGSLDAWRGAIDAMYNKPNEEHRQYAIASSFGCALTPLTAEESYNGILFAITGGRTSMGKTTVARSALSIWGDPSKFVVGTEDGTTQNSMWATVGTYQNIPMLFDEYTHIGADEFSKMCYTITTGVEKSRMVASRGSGVTFAESASWRVAPFVTANKDLHALLSTRGGSSEAEAVRLIQVHIDEHKMPEEDLLVWQGYTHTLRDNTGVAGDVFVRYMVQNKAEVLAIMGKWMRRLVEDVPERKYRFYRGHAECSMAALEIAVKLGLVQFDVEAVYAYAIRLFTRLAKDVEENNTSTTEDAISEMINSLSPGIAVTEFYRDLRAESEPEVVRIHGEWTGRVIRGSKGNKEPLAGRMYLAMQAVKVWCAKSRISYTELIKECAALGIWIPLESQRFVLGRGTNIPTGQTRCICLNYAKLQELYGFAFLRDATAQNPSPSESEPQKRAAG